MEFKKLSTRGAGSFNFVAGDTVPDNESDDLRFNDKAVLDAAILSTDHPDH